MSVQYLADLKLFRLTFRDYMKSAKDGKARYTSARYHFIDAQGNPYTPTLKPTKRMIDKRTKELEVVARQLEEQSKSGLIEPAKRSKENITLIAMLEAIKDNPTRHGSPQAVIFASRTVQELIVWLSAKAPLMVAKDLQERAILRFLSDRYCNLMASSISRRKKALSSAWNILAKRFSLALVNPFLSITQEDLLKVSKSKTQEVFCLGYTEDYIKGFYSFIKSKKDKELEAMFYLIICTGWRLGDILSLQSTQINMKERTIDLLHNKTKKSTKARTIIYITDHCKSLLSALNITKQGRLFRLQKATLKIHAHKALEEYFNEHKPIGFQIYHTQKGNRYSHNIQGFRKSFITNAKKAGYNNEIVRYIAGHAGKNIEETNYNSFLIDPKGTTEPVIRYMERIITKGKQTPKEQRLQDLQELVNNHGFSLDELKKLLR